jgi:hypothetical protein
VLEWNSRKHLTTTERVGLPKDVTTEGLSLLDDFRRYLIIILLLLFLQKQSLAFAVYLFGIGTLLTGLGSKKNTCDNVLTTTSKAPW